MLIPAHQYTKEGRFGAVPILYRSNFNHLHMLRQYPSYDLKEMYNKSSQKRRDIKVLSYELYFLKGGQAPIHLNLSWCHCTSRTQGDIAMKMNDVATERSV